MERQDMIAQKAKSHENKADEEDSEPKNNSSPKQSLFMIFKLQHFSYGLPSTNLSICYFMEIFES